MMYFTIKITTVATKTTAILNTLITIHKIEQLEYDVRVPIFSVVPSDSVKVSISITSNKLHF